MIITTNIASNFHLVILSKVTQFCSSVKSSESSGHLGSIEVSECSETLVESSLEYEQRLDDGTDTPSTINNLDELNCDMQDTAKHLKSSFSIESSSSTELSKHSFELNTTKRVSHIKTSSSSSIPNFDSSLQEMQCLPEDDIDG